MICQNCGQRTEPEVLKHASGQESYLCTNCEWIFSSVDYSQGGLFKKKRPARLERLIRYAWELRKNPARGYLPAWRKREMIKRRLKAELEENTK